ncbi:hypothetical protein [Haliangium ochraceum]|uniref:Uncharacterized protein n=1 Tax=Haliangium ochraceum (strain DSM 14365 / JCM 11303 / SMP-2) TaxID=502025 RepID=D0LQR4_HALO1|nr:hypothetical protein [Haliangium ochraceum]ACY13624.1 conserved hypothetical protein [Haliangium ochraceum DSM 14365]
MTMRSAHLRPAGITCPSYEPRPGTTRCRSYLDGGVCTRADEFLCVEWLRANGHAVPESAKASAPVPGERLGTELSENTPTSSSPAADAVRGLTSEQLASFAALGVEVCLATAEVGEVWLVPKYTDCDRQELRLDHAATLAALCATFPGASVKVLEPLAGRKHTSGEVAPS